MSSPKYTAATAASSAAPAWQTPVYPQGCLVTSTCTFASAGTPADPTTVTATVTRGDGHPVTTAPTKTATGVYVVTVDTTPAAGAWRVSWFGAGAVQAVAEEEFLVSGGR